MDMELRMGMGMGKALSAPTGEYIAPLARAQRLVSEVRTTCWCRSGDATIRRAAFGDRLVSHDRALVLRVCGALVGREEVGAQLILLRLLLYT